MSSPLEKTDSPLVEKLGHAMNRIHVAMRADSWDAFGANDLNPTQGQIALLLGRRSSGLRLSEIADELAVSSPTVSDSVAALVEKGLVKKDKAKDDGRAVAVRLTAAGKRMIKRLDLIGGTIGSVISRLPHSEQVQLYKTLIRMVRELQLDGRIPISRMCVTCRYFRPNAHKDPKRPHHCEFVNVAFGDRTIRVDCPDHEPAEEHIANQNCKVFSG
ncbi:MAG: MarR family winged helix-turn-helix transcriptional regulator [Phycisphaerales bacterium]|nr:MarR family winged helix-turn-helix transcriptional regulator [Phycisphaerales bacterium]